MSLVYDKTNTERMLTEQVPVRVIYSDTADSTVHVVWRAQKRTPDGERYLEEIFSGQTVIHEFDTIIEAP